MQVRVIEDNKPRRSPPLPEYGRHNQVGVTTVEEHWDHGGTPRRQVRSVELPDERVNYKYDGRPARNTYSRISASPSSTVSYREPTYQHTTTTTPGGRYYDDRHSSTIRY